MLKIGDKAPDFTLPTGDGETMHLKDFRGKNVVLFFYPEDDTPTCTEEACSFQENLAALKASGAVVLGVSADSIESHRKFARKYDLTYPLLSDEQRRVLRLYGVWQKKTLFGRKFMGIVRTTFVIDRERRIRHIFPRVRVKTHAAQVLEVLKKIDNSIVA